MSNDPKTAQSMSSGRGLKSCLVAVVLALAGCGGDARTPIGFPAAPAEAGPVQTGDESAQIAADPTRYLRDTLQRCQTLHEYAVDFRRQERRRTLFGESLSNEEHMRVKYRIAPLSIRMDMSPPSTFSSVAYVEGQHDGKLRCKWRKSLLPGAEPPVNDYDLMSAVKFGFSRSPVTDFGVARLMELILATLDRMTESGHPPTVRYLGVARLEPQGPAAHHIELQYDPDTELERPKVDLLVHTDSGLPAGCYLWREDQELDAKYLYTDFDVQPGLSEQDFAIE